MLLRFSMTFSATAIYFKGGWARQAPQFGSLPRI